MTIQEIAPAAPSLPEWNLYFHQHPTSYATHGLHSFAAKCPPPLVAWILRHIGMEERMRTEYVLVLQKVKP